MARSRNIKPGFFTNPELVELPYETRLLFAGLWTVADRRGRLQDRPKKIKMEVFPADTVDIDTMLDQLHKAGFICRYVVGEEKLILINNWDKHQAPHHTEKRSVLPPAPHEPETDITPFVNGYDTVDPPDHLRGNPPDSLIPDSGFTDSLIRSPLGGDPSPGKPEPAARGSRLDPEWTLLRAWGLWALGEFPHWTEEVVRSEAAKFKDHWLSESGAKARKVDWLATWRKWCRSDIAQKAHPPPGQGTETNYTRQMRERVEEAAGSMAHIVAAKAPGTPKTPTPWDAAIESNSRTTAIGMDRYGVLEADGQIRPRLSEPV